MARYTVPLTSWADIAVTVETDETDPEKIADLAIQEASVSLCHQCADSRNNSLVVGDEWSPTTNDDGTPEVTKESDAQADH